LRAVTARSFKPVERLIFDEPHEYWRLRSRHISGRRRKTRAVSRNPDTALAHADERPQPASGDWPPRPDGRASGSHRGTLLRFLSRLRKLPRPSP
jgi:hypothetical protein